MLSLVIPVYNNEANLPRLFDAIDALAGDLGSPLEVVFVVDGATDRSAERIGAEVAGWTRPAQLLQLSRNFGSFAAISAGLRYARGTHMAVMAADLQEPPSLVLDFHRRLISGEVDIVMGQRLQRDDGAVSGGASRLFWALYRRYVVPGLPSGGVDIFGCTAVVRDRLVELPEQTTNLVALLFWLGYRREFLPYDRQARREGRSGWTISRKIRYALDSIFNFTDLPVRALLWIGAIGTGFGVIAGVTVLIGYLLGQIPVLGYTPLMLVVTFFGSLTALGLGIVGQYLWLTLQNTRRRPNYVVRTIDKNVS